VIKHNENLNAGKYNPALFDDTIDQLISTTNGPICANFRHQNDGYVTVQLLSLT